MSDLRKAAEMALEFIVLSSKDRAWFTEKEFEVVAALRQALAQPDDFVYSEDKSYRVSPETGSFGIGDTPSKQEPEWIEDGFGTMWQKCGKKDCGKFVVKIGKVDCWNGDCPEVKEMK